MGFTGSSLATGSFGSGDGGSAGTIKSGGDSNIIFRDSKGNILKQPVDLSEEFTIDVYYV